MRKKIILGIIFLIGFIAFATFSYNVLHAQQANKGLSVTPYSLDLTIKPGASVTKSITLTNFTDKTLDISVDARNFSANGEEGEVVLDKNEASQYSLLSWIKVNPQKITLTSNQKQSFDVTISVPNNAEPGGHFGSVVFATVPSKDLKTSGAVLSQEIAALILVRIPGNANEQAVIKSFTTGKKFYEFGPIPFEIRVKNNGNVHVKGGGIVTVTNMLGQKSYAQIEERNILPNATRKLLAVLQSRLLIGKYTATVSFAYGTQNNALLIATTTFWAFPIRIGIFALIVFIILFLMRKRLYKAGKALITGK